jgi:hypothetical protein
VNVMCGSVDAALGANAWSYGVTSGHNVCDTPQFLPESDNQINPYKSWT